MLQTRKFCQNQPLATKINFAFKLTFFTLVLLLTACGGGAENENEETVEADDGTTLSIKLVDATGAEVRNLDKNGTAIISATLKSSNGTALSNAVITFKGDLATLDPEDGTELTDGNGVATIDLTAGTTAGAGKIQATATAPNDEVITASFSYAVAGTTEPNQKTTSNFTLKLLDADGNEIRKLERNTPATIEVTLLDNNGGGIANEVVAFSSDLVTISSDKATAITDANGKATIQIVAGSSIGADYIIATSDFVGGDKPIKYGYQVFGDPGTPIDPPEVTPGEEGAVSKSVTGSIQFVSASPEKIVLRNTGGTGNSEFSTISFQLIGSDGLPMEGRTVNFTLSETTDIGGLAIDPVSAITNSEGLVSTTLQAGSVPTVISVKAVANVKDVKNDNQQVEAFSSNLIVSTGRPDKNSFTLSLSRLNPPAWNENGVEVDVTAHLGDQNNNWIPDGTAVYFTTEGGSIEPSCTTINNACSVKWISQNPRPTDHRVTILASTLGSESFIDTDSDGVYTLKDGEPFLDIRGNNIGGWIFRGNNIYDEPFNDENGNGIFDEPFVDLNSIYEIGDIFVDHNNDGAFNGDRFNSDGENDFTDSNNGNRQYDGTGRIPAGEEFADIADTLTGEKNGLFDGPGFADLGEPFLDKNENGIRDYDEEYFDSNNDGIFDAKGDKKYTGMLCQEGNNCSDKDALLISESAILIMSGNRPYVTLTNNPDVGTVYRSDHGFLENGARPIDISEGDSIDLIAFITDSARQVLPVGTKIEVSCDVCKAYGKDEILNTIGRLYPRNNLNSHQKYDEPNAQRYNELSDLAFENMHSMGISLVDEDPAETKDGMLIIKVTVAVDNGTIEYEITYPVRA